MKKYLFFLLIFIFSCNSKTENQYFDTVAQNDIKLTKPEVGDWLYEHNEKSQTFEEYLKSNPTQLADSLNIIYLKPFGKFTSLQEKQIELTKEYLEIFFQLKAKIQTAIFNDIIPENARRLGAEYNEQILASYVLDSILKKEKLNNGAALMAISELDLYPNPDWNYVFGLASYEKRVGISSICRLQGEKLTEENFNLCLRRLLNICSHEIGHMFGLHHCIHANCVMNGSNSLEETDRNTSRLCSNCQKKLNYKLNYKNEKRLAELITFFKKNNLDPEVVLLQKDFDCLKK